MKTYIAKSNIKSGGKTYKAGDEISLDTRTAQILLDDNIITEVGNNIEVEDTKTPQPAVNVVKRKGNNSTGEVEVKAGKGDMPDKDEKAVEIKETYKVIKNLKFRGTVYKIGDTIDLTSDLFVKFQDGFIELVAEEDNL